MLWTWRRPVPRAIGLFPAPHYGRPPACHPEEFDMAPTPQKIANLIASEIKASAAQVSAAVGLLDEGATVPFIARYRKEVTGGLDDTQLRTLAERLTYLRELEARRASI